MGAHLSDCAQRTNAIGRVLAQRVPQWPERAPNKGNRRTRIYEVGPIQYRLISVY